MNGSDKPPARLIQRLEESAQLLVTLNGAGTAGVVGLMQRAGPIPIGTRAAGVLFLAGIMAGAGAWICSFVRDWRESSPPPEHAYLFPHALIWGLMAFGAMSFLSFFGGLLTVYFSIMYDKL